MKVMIDLPKESAELLVSMYINEDSSLKQFSIKSVEIQKGLQNEPDDGNPKKNESGNVFPTATIQNDINNPIFRGKLRRTIIACFSENDLQNICFDLNIDYENIPGDGKEAKVREILVYCERNGLLDIFVHTCSTERPNIDFIPVIS